MRRLCLLLMALGTTSAVALAQTGSSPSGSAPSGSAPAAGAPSGAGAPALAPTTPGTPGASVPGRTQPPGSSGASSLPSGTAPRTNTDIFPPSRVLPSPAPSTTSQTPSSTSPNAAQPGGSSEQIPPPSQASGGRPQPGGANSSRQSQETRTPDQRTGKNALNERLADCMRLWEPATHMTKQEWSRTCRRIQNHLDSTQGALSDRNNGGRTRVR
jgi:hypothetical protein